MFGFLKNRKSRYGRLLLCFFVVCILAASFAYEKPELEKLPYSAAGGADAISAPVKGAYDIVVCKAADFSVIKTAVPRNYETGRFAGSGTAPVCTLAIGFLALTGIYVFFLLLFCRDLITSHHFIIAYIHDLDGMKP